MREILELWGLRGQVSGSPTYGVISAKSGHPVEQLHEQPIQYLTSFRYVHWTDDPFITIFQRSKRRKEWHRFDLPYLKAKRWN